MNALPLRVTSTEQRTNLVIRRGKKNAFRHTSDN